MSRPGLRTRAARAGSYVGPDGSPLVPAIEQSTVGRYGSLEALEAVYDGSANGYVYYRNGHANAATLEGAVADLERAPAAAAAASGMAAILAAWLSVVSAGDHVLADRRVYGGTHALLTQELPRLGVAATLVDAGDPAAVRAAVGPRTRLLHLEALSNPTVRVADLPALAALARELGLVVVVDSTFASPALLRPLEHGADIALHSLAKYLGGHASAVGGILAGRHELVTAARARLVALGATLGPFDAWLALHGLRTLPLRMRAHSENASAAAAFLAAHPRVSRVEHPSLPGHPQRALAARLFPHGTGGVLAFEVDGARDGAARLVRRLAGRIPLAPSLADVATTLSYPAGTSHRALSRAERELAGVTDGLLRLSAGIEDPEDLLADLAFGLADA